jgi:hypothetical protein
MVEGQLANITLAAAIRCGSPQEDLLVDSKTWGEHFEKHGIPLNDTTKPPPKKIIYMQCI